MTPELTITRPCPRCGGTGYRNLPDAHPDSHVKIKWYCPDCDQGVVRVAVSCQTCEMWNEEFEECGIAATVDSADEYEIHWLHTVDGCTRWQAKEATNGN